MGRHQSYWNKLHYCCLCEKMYGRNKIHILCISRESIYNIASASVCARTEARVGRGRPSSAFVFDLFFWIRCAWLGPRSLGQMQEYLEQTNHMQVQRTMILKLKKNSPLECWRIFENNSPCPGARLIIWKHCVCDAANKEWSKNSMFVDKEVMNFLAPYTISPIEYHCCITRQSRTLGGVSLLGRTMKPKRHQEPKLLSKMNMLWSKW